MNFATYADDCHKATEATYSLGLQLARTHARTGRLEDSPALTDDALRLALRAVFPRSSTFADTLALWEDRHGTIDRDDLQDTFQSGYWAGHANAHVGG